MATSCCSPARPMPKRARRRHRRRMRAIASPSWAWAARRAPPIGVRTAASTGPGSTRARCRRWPARAGAATRRCRPVAPTWMRSACSIRRAPAHAPRRARRTQRGWTRASGCCRRCCWSPRSRSAAAARWRRSRCACACCCRRRARRTPQLPKARCGSVRTSRPTRACSAGSRPTARAISPRRPTRSQTSPAPMAPTTSAMRWRSRAATRRPFPPTTARCGGSRAWPTRSPTARPCSKR